MKIHCALLALLFVLVGCVSSQREKAQVLVSIPPYMYFVEALVGDNLEIVCLAPPGSNPHIYEPTPKQVQKAQSAKLWIRLNDSFEIKVAQALSLRSPEMNILNLAQSKEIPYIYEQHFCSGCKHNHSTDMKDLHIWLSPKMAKIQASLVANALIESFPNLKEHIQKNLISFQKKLSLADSEFTEKLKPFKGNGILISHPALGYFCRDYELKQISIEVEGKDPQPSQLKSILDYANNHTIRTIFTQAQYNNKGTEIIAEKLKLPTHQIDPYSANYMQNLYQIVQYIVEP